MPKVQIQLYFTREEKTALRNLAIRRGKKNLAALFYEHCNPLVREALAEQRCDVHSPTSHNSDAQTNR